MMRFMCLMIAALFAASAGREEGVAGRWVAMVGSPDGEVRTTFEFEVDGETLTGSVENERAGRTEIRSGRVDGNRISFHQDIRIRGFTLEVRYAGVFAGDEIAFTRRIEPPSGGRGGRAGRRSGGGRVEFTALRASDPEP